MSPDRPNSDTTTDYVPVHVPDVPPQLGDFAVREKLGEGGMGCVYLAEQASKKRLVALKVLPKSLSARPGFVQRFQREVRATGRLDHPNLVKYLAAGEADGCLYLAMELIDGGTLAARVARGPLPVADALFVAAEVGKALQYAHERGLVHRDVKPENVLLTADGRVKLADLGLAKVAGESAVDLTATGVGLGTPLYAPPEQVRDAKHADARSDLYALGGVLYAMLVGRPPFAGGDLISVLKAKERGTFAAASVAARGVPAAVDRVVSRLLAKLPEHRYQSAAEFLQDVEWLGLAGHSLPA